MIRRSNILSLVICLSALFNAQSFAQSVERRQPGGTPRNEEPAGGRAGGERQHHRSSSK